MKALFVVDVQKFFENKKTAAIAKKIDRHIKKHKEGYRLILFTVFKNDDKAPLRTVMGWNGCNKEKDTEIIGELADTARNYEIIIRNTYSLLKSPRIRGVLKKSKIEEVDICGFDTDCCVLATAYDLFDSGYKSAVLKNLCYSTSNEKLHNPALKIIKRNCGFVK
jgi:nicotinamidase-related amidase